MEKVQTNRKRFRLLRLSLLAVFFGSGFAESLKVTERAFPVAYDVDVLVVGGTSGGVAAAAAAAREGRSVFLMAQRPYLGEDLSGAYRLWPAQEQSGLVSEILKTPTVLDYCNLPFTYSADLPSAGKHVDTTPASMLTDGLKDNITKDTVQYDGNVTIIAELPESRQVDRVQLVAFQRPAEYCALYLDLFVSEDGNDWEKVGVEKDIEYVTRQKTFSIDVGRTARYVKLQVKKAPQTSRVLLSEIEIQYAEERALGLADRYPPTPLHVKRTLDQILLDANVDFLYGCYPTDVLRDSQGNVSGVIMVNRSGRQIVRAKQMIDATPTAMLARMAGAPMRAGDPVHRFTQVAVADKPRELKNGSVRPTLTPVYHKGEEHPAFEYTFSLTTGPLDIHSFAEAQQQVLDQAWTPGQLAASEYAFTVPTESIVSLKSHAGACADIPVEAMQSAALPGVYVLSGYADVSRSCAADLLEPVNYIPAGERIGKLAASRAVGREVASSLVVREPDAAALADAALKESLAPLRPEHTADETVQIGETSYPVLGHYNVVVVGGGTSGAPAALGAARGGAKTLVVEYQHGFGGVGTVGLIGRYWRGYVKGFTLEVDAGVRGLRPEGAPEINGWDIYDKMEWYRQQLRDAGAEMWMRSIAWGAVVKAGDVQGVAVSTPFGTGIVLADVVIDSTGNGDIAIAAGAQYDFLAESRIAIQGVGLPAFDLGDHYNNSDFSVAYESDPRDLWHLKVYGKSEYRTKDSYDVASLVDTRERRRVIGDFYLTVPDQLMGRVYPDTIARAYSDYDCHGVNYSSYVFLQPTPEPTSTYIPYHCLLPKGLDGILVTGMGISVDHDALPLIRMQPDLQNQGYAAGVAAAVAAEKGIEPRDVDVRKLQGHLVEIGNIPPEILTEKDIYPCSVERVKAAVERAPEEYNLRVGRECSIMLAHSEISKPLLLEACATSTGEKKRFYAHALAVMGDPAELDTLIEYVKAQRWDAGNRNTTSKMSEMDRLIAALAVPGDRRVTEAIIEKARQLQPGSEFSHFRSVVMAFDLLRDPAAVPVLQELLNKPGVSGNAVQTIEEARAADRQALENMGPQIQEKFTFEARMLAIREISLARALYLCGDSPDHLGRRILQDYTTDLRGVLAAHAVSVLKDAAGDGVQ